MHLNIPFNEVATGNIRRIRETHRLWDKATSKWEPEDQHRKATEGTGEACAPPGGQWRRDLLLCSHFLPWLDVKGSRYLAVGGYGRGEV